MNRRQKKKRLKKWNENHVTLINTRTGAKSIITVNDLKILFDLAGFDKNDIANWINKSKDNEYC